MFAALSAAVFASCTKEQQTVTPSAPSVEANWSSSAAFGSWSNGGYDFLNDIWGTGSPAPGPQTIWANSYHDWGVWAQHTGSGIKSYPHVGKTINNYVNSLSSCKSTFAVINPSGGSFSTDYDIWLNTHQFEIMLWTNKQGNVGPIADQYDSNGGIPYYTNQNIGGHTWTVYAGNGQNAGQRVFSFIRTSNTAGGTIDLLAIFHWLQWAATQKSAFGGFTNPKVQDVQFGWEITNTDGVGKNFGCTNFDITNN